MNADIAIVGGGTIGASLALVLQSLSHKMKIALIESVSPEFRAEEEFDARSLSLSPSSQRIFASVGLWQKLKNYALPIKHIHVSDKGHFWANRFHAASEGLDALGYVIEIADLNRIVNDDCQRSSSITYYCPAELESLNMNEQGAELMINHLGEKQSVQCRLVIAADGSYSKVRQLQNIQHTEWDYEQSAIVANIGLSRDHYNTAYERFTAKGPIALLPLTRQRSALVWSMPKNELNDCLQLSANHFLTALQAHFGYRLGRFVKVGKRSAFPLKAVLANETIASSLVLIGNAAQTISPVAGQGFNLGLRDVATLATILTEAIKQGNDIASQTVLQQYEKWRQWDRLQTLALTDGLTRLYSNNYLAHSLLRKLCMIGVSAIPTAKQILLQYTMGLSGRLPDLACGLAFEKCYDEAI